MIKDLKLEVLEDTMSTGLSPRNGGYMHGAASVCLDHCKHALISSFHVRGYINQEYNLVRCAITDADRKSFGDLEEATEYGAMGVAIAIIHDQTQWQVKRAWKGTYFDFWVGNSNGAVLFQEYLKLEISGDLKGTDAEVEARLKIKTDQIRRSAQPALLSCVIIVEFGTPKSITHVE